MNICLILSSQVLVTGKISQAVVVAAAAYRSQDEFQTRTGITQSQLIVDEQHTNTHVRPLSLVPACIFSTQRCTAFQWLASVGQELSSQGSFGHGWCVESMCSATCAANKVLYALFAVSTRRKSGLTKAAMAHALLPHSPKPDGTCPATAQS